MLHLTHAARRAAVPKLKAFQQAPQTVSQAIMFQEWLENPRVTKQNLVFEEMKRKNCGSSLAGPLRLGSIQQQSVPLLENIVILSYQKKIDEEHSCVAIFDNGGAFVTYYELVPEQYYETYVDKNVMTGSGRTFNRKGGANTSDPSIYMQSTAYFHVGDRSDARWELTTLGLEWFWQEGFAGDVTFPNHALFKLFHGILSPTEASMVLMHALSSDTRVIYVYTLAVFDSLDEDIFDDSLRDEVFDEVEAPAVDAWRRNLPGV